MDTTAIIIAGPTAVGKTAFAIEIARHFQTEIISADSRQCYKELNIGVARPKEEDLQKVPHHFVASHAVTENITAASFEQFALEKASQVLREKSTVIVSGGTGLYIKAFCEGLDLIPEVDPAIRQRIIAGYESKGLSWLHEELQNRDPLFAEKGEMKNPQRMMRALEVIEATGMSIISYRNKKKEPRDFNIVKIGLHLPMKELEENINRRVKEMVEKGLVEEVQQLIPYKNLNALRTVGYLEIFEWLDGLTSFNEAVEKIKINTRQYAKRQLTWFKKDKEFTWFKPNEISAVIKFLSTVHVKHL